MKGEERCRSDASNMRTVPISEHESASTAADIRALAEQADAEAAAAEARAAAAQARVHALQLRRQAELVEAKARQGKRQNHDVVDAANVTSDRSGRLSEIESEGEVSEDEPTQDTTEEILDDGADSDVDTSSAHDTVDTQPRLRGLSRLSRIKASTIVTGAAILAIALALSGSVRLVIEHREAVRLRQHAAEFSAAARQGVVTLTSMDFNNANQSVQRVIDDATGSFKDEFQKTAGDFVKVVEQSKVISHGTVESAAVDLDTMTDTSAVVLVASTSEITNAAGAKQDPRSYRLIVTIARDGDQLKMSKVEFVP